MFCEVVVDGGNQLVDAGEAVSFESILGDVAKESFDHVEPGCAGGSEVHMESGVTLQPPLHRWVFVGRVVVGDQMQFFVG